MKFFNFFTRKKDEDADYDWRDLDALPKEIVSEKELDAMQDEVVKKIDKFRTGHDQTSRRYTNS